MIKAALLYRIAFVVLVLMAAGHTYGFLTFRPPSLEGRAVLEAMRSVHFQVGHASYSYGHFYVGFGLFATIYMLFAAFVAWHLAGLAKTNPSAIGALGWALFVVQLGSLAISWIYISAAPATLSAIVALCAGWAALIA